MRTGTPNLLSPNSPGLESSPTMRTLTRSRAVLMPRTFRWRPWARGAGQRQRTGLGPIECADACQM